MNNHVELMFGIHQLLMYFHQNGLITTGQFLDVLDNCNVANGIPKAIEYAKSNLKKEERYVSIPVDVDLAKHIDSASYDNTTKIITFTLTSGATFTVPIDDIIYGLPSRFCEVPK